LVVFILAILQVFLGVVIDKLFEPGREAIPIQDIVHWWLGRLIFLLALVNIFIGLVYYTSTSFVIAFVVWCVFVIVLMVFFQFTIGQSHHHCPPDADEDEC
jgi:sorbitol-specific phosphotransferase system component IIBC